MNPIFLMKITMKKLIYLFGLVISFYSAKAQDFSPVLIRTGETFRVNTFTSYSNGCGSNLFQDKNKGLHMAYIDNYKLYYGFSANEGTTWLTSQVVTGFEGKIKNAGIVVSSDGKVFIPFEIHPNYNYGLAPIDYPQFIYQIHCATKNPGGTDWQNVLLVNNNTSNNQGSNLSDVVIDSSNNVHVFSSNYGWYTYGGGLKESVYNAQTQTWTTQSILNLNDAPVDNFLASPRAVINSNGDMAVIFWRTYFNRYDYIIKPAGGSWQAPQVFDSNPAFRGYSLFAGPDGAFHIVWIKGNDPYIALHKKGFAATQTDTIFKSPTGISISPFLHIDQANRITLLLARSGNDSAMLFIKEPTSSNWSLANELFPATNPITGLFVAKRAQNKFSHFQTLFIKYLRQGTTGPHGPDKLYFWQKFNRKAVSIVSNPAGINASLFGSGSYKIDSLVTVSAIAPANYNFISWTNEQNEVLSTDSLFSFQMPYQNITLTANFEIQVSRKAQISKSGFEVFPNPSTGTFFIRSTDAFSFKCRDVSGRIVLSGTRTPGLNTIELARPMKGVYYLEIMGKDLSLYKKLVVQ